MARVISVLPQLDWWAVRFDAVDNDMLFVSGAQAQAAAKALARRLADHGESALIRVYLKDGDLAATILCPGRGLKLALTG